MYQNLHFCKQKIICNYLLVTIIELTCPWEERLDQAREHKTNKYTSLINDLHEQGHAVIFIPLEIGVRGIINHKNRRSIQDIAHYTVMNNPKALGKSLSRESVIQGFFGGIWPLTQLEI